MMEQEINAMSGEETPETTGGGKKTVKIIIASVLGLILVVASVATIYVNSRLGLMNRVNTDPETTLSQAEIDAILQNGGEGDGSAIMNTDDGIEADDNLISGEEDLVSHGEGVINILVIGQDSRGSYVAKLSDTMILCTLNLDTKELTLTSFMRDMYVKLPNYNGMICGSNRINVCYALGGMGMLDQCLYENFGVEVDHNVEISFEGFTSIIDLLGGIDITLTKAEASYLNKSTAWGLTEGKNHLTGEQALAYARIRKIDSDFYRTERQRTVMMTVIEMCKSMSVTQLDSILSQVLPLVTTDMTNSDIYGYMKDILYVLSDLEISTLRIPADGTYYGANKGTEEQPMYVLIPNLEKNREILKEAIGTKND